MRLVFAFILLGSISFFSGCSGQCDYPDDRARDGSRCGDRAASVRPGGRDPDSQKFVWLLIGAVVVTGYLQLRKDHSDKGLNSDFKSEPLKNILEPVGLGGLVDKSPGYAKRRGLQIHGPRLVEILRWSGSKEFKDESEALIQLGEQSQRQQMDNYRYFITSNSVESTPKYPLISERNNIVLFVVKSDDRLISVEKVHGGKSDGFLHPDLIIEEGSKMFDLSSSGKWQIASHVNEVSFKEFQRIRSVEITSFS